MEPVKFTEANKNLLKPSEMTDEECASLWVFSDGQQCVSRWRLTLRDRLRVLWYGHVWLSVHSGFTQPPVRLDSTKTVFQTPEESLRQESERFAA
jgi:hypothetical protein